VDEKLKIPVIDIFAGPGGLGEGFSSFSKNGFCPFDIKLSIEKDPLACRTLRLRSFFRKVPFDHMRKPFLKFLQSNRNEKDEEVLFGQFEAEKKEVHQEVKCKELGSYNFPPEVIDGIIRSKINDSKNWVLIGGPPCQAYSTVGRARMSRVRKTHLSSFESDERHYLYQHYLRIIASHEPPVFVMENVKGLLSSSIKGKLIIQQILKDLKSPGDNGLKYRLFPFIESNSQGDSLFEGHDGEFDASDFIIKAENFGIPQMRHRLIILGVRSDISERPTALKANDTFKTVGEVLSDLPPIRSGIGLKWDRTKSWFEHIQEIKAIFSNETIPESVRRLMVKYIDRLAVGLPKGGAYLKYRSGVCQASCRLN